MCIAEFLYIYTYEDTPENYYEDVSLNQDVHYAIHTSSPSCMKKCTKLPGVPVGFHYTCIFLHACIWKHTLHMSAFCVQHQNCGVGKWGGGGGGVAAMIKATHTIL